MCEVSTRNIIITVSFYKVGVSMSVFAERVKLERERKKDKDPKWTQDFVAKKLGVARTTYTAYEAGTKEPPMDTVIKIADLYDVDVDYLFGRTEKRRSMEMSLSFYGGGDDLTEDEIEEMEAALFRYRKTKERLQKQIEENEKK